MNIDMTKPDKYGQFQSAAPVTCPFGNKNCAGCHYHRRCPAQDDALKKGQVKVTTQF